MLKMFQLVSFATELISKQTNKYATLDWRKVTKGYKSRFRSVVSSRERSAAKRRTTTLCFVKRVRIVIFETLKFLHLLIVS